MVTYNEVREVTNGVREALQLLHEAWTALPRLKGLAKQLNTIVPMLQTAHLRYMQSNHVVDDVADDPVLPRIHAVMLNIVPLVEQLRAYVEKKQKKWEQHKHASKMVQFLDRVRFGVVDVGTQRVLCLFGKKAVKDYQQALDEVIQQFRDVLQAEAAGQMANVREQVAVVDERVQQTHVDVQRVCAQVQRLERQLQTMERPLRTEWQGTTESQEQQLNELARVRKMLRELSSSTSMSLDELKSAFRAQRKQMVSFVEAVRDASEYGEGIRLDAIPAIEKDVSDINKQIAELVRAQQEHAATSTQQLETVQAQVAGVDQQVQETRALMAREFVELKCQMERLEVPIRYEWEGSVEAQQRQLEELSNVRNAISDLSGSTTQSVDGLKAAFLAQKNQLSAFITELRGMSEFGEGIALEKIPSIDDKVTLLTRQMAQLLRMHASGNGGSGAATKTLEQQLMDARRLFRRESEDDPSAPQQLFVPALVCRRNALATADTSNTQDAVTTMLDVLTGESPDNTQKSFLLMGDSGSGKTTLLQRGASALWQRWDEARGSSEAWIPIFVRLPALSDAKTRLIDETLERYGFDAAAITELRESRRVVFFLDAYDELQLRVNFFVTANLSDWSGARFCISCRTEYADMMGAYSEWLSPPDGGCDEWHVTPFNRRQIESYLSLFIANHADAPFRTVDEYVEVMDRLPGVWEMCHNPFLLSVLADVLPAVLRQFGSSDERIQRRQLFEVFVEKWLKRSMVRFMCGDDDDEDILDFRGDCRLVCRCVARAMYESQTTVVSLGASDAASVRWKSAKKAVRSGCPLRKVGRDAYEFLHKSLLEYFVSEDVFDLIMGNGRRDDDGDDVETEILGRVSPVVDDDDDDSSSSDESDSSDSDTASQSQCGSLAGVVHEGHHLGQRLLSNEPQILLLLGERAFRDSSFASELWKWVLRSRDDARCEIVAANALSILNWGNVSLAHRDLRGIRVRGANLSKAQLQFSDLRGAVLDECVMDDAVLEYASLEGARMGGVSWLVRPPLRGHTVSVESVAVTPDGTRIVSGSADDSIRLWDLASGECLWTREEHTGWVECVAVSSDGTRIVSGSDDHSIRVWELTKGECLRTLSGHTADVLSVAVTHDGKWIVSGSGDCSVRLWNAETGECVRTFSGHAEAVNSVAVTLDGKWIVSGSGDCSIRVWNAETGECVRTMTEGCSISSVSVTPDGKQIVSDGSFEVRVWDMETGKCLRTLKTYTEGQQCRCDFQRQTDCLRQPGLHHPSVGRTNGRMSPDVYRTYVQR